jgi:hypothetical protein
MTESIATLEARLKEDYLHPDTRAELERKIAEKALEES